MLKTPAFLSFSMVRRNNRRLLVATTYATLMVLMAAYILLLPSKALLNAITMGFILAYNGVSRAMFGRLVKQTVLPEIHGGELISLRLAAPGRPRRSEDDLDEREVTVRNAAHFEAYCALALYSIALWVASPFFFSLRPSMGVRGFMLLALPLLVMALTLPQAVVLWTEPDVPGEARV
jgi:hypothetical protein